MKILFLNLFDDPAEGGGADPGIGVLEEAGQVVALARGGRRAGSLLLR